MQTTDADKWQIRYRLAAEEAPVMEFYTTKQMARDRFFTVRAFKNLAFVELRNPFGAVWFRDHWFDGDHREIRNPEDI